MQAPESQQARTITVPEGTRVQLALANPIRTRAAQVGDAVRAVTTFPVTVGEDLAIPQGTYFEGSVVKIGKRGSTKFDGLEIEFNQVVFTNGYHQQLQGSVAEAKALDPGANSILLPGTTRLFATALPLPQQQAQTPPPLPQVGPSKAAVIGASLGGTAALIVTLALLGRHRGRGEPADFDTGFQFELVLQAPLTLDSSRIAAAVNGASGR